MTTRTKIFGTFVYHFWIDLYGINQELLDVPSCKVCMKTFQTFLRAESHCLTEKLIISRRSEGDGFLEKCLAKWLAKESDFLLKLLSFEHPQNDR